MQIVIIGGGAAGFFAALSCKQHNPKARVVILERSDKLLTKVLLSGGGRCNVTHACFSPKDFVINYPRGSKELLGPLHRFGPRDTVEWFEKRGIFLKTEKDKRMFPKTNTSQTIYNCLTEEAKRLGVEVRKKVKILSIKKQKEAFFLITEDDSFLADRIILATGSGKNGHTLAEDLGHTIVSPVPSLFTFKVKDFSLKELSGISVFAELSFAKGKCKQTGPLLITHFGFSGPAALKLSAREARYLAEKKYHDKLYIDWLVDLSFEEFYNKINDPVNEKKHLESLNCRGIPKKLWKTFCQRAGLSLPIKTLSKKRLIAFYESLKKDSYQMIGKALNKEEFVTCGGVDLKQVDFKTMQSKICSDLYFCGEVLDIDGVTGGFNFQNAWTTGYIAGKSSAS